MTITINIDEPAVTNRAMRRKAGKRREKMIKTLTKKAVKAVHEANRANERKERATPLSESQATSISVLHWICFRAITENGDATESNWTNLAQAINMGLLLAEKGIGDEHMNIVKDAQDAMMRARRRGLEHGRWMFDGDGIKAVEQALLLHDEQVRVATKGELVECLATLRKRIEDGNTLS